MSEYRATVEWQLHEKTHHRCFIANSVKSEVIIEPRIV